MATKITDLPILALALTVFAASASAAVPTCEEVLSFKAEVRETYLKGIRDGFRVASSIVLEGLARDAVANPSTELGLSRTLEHWHNWLVNVGSEWWCLDNSCPPPPGIVQCAAPRNLKTAYTAVAIEDIAIRPQGGKIVDLGETPFPLPKWDEKSDLVLRPPILEGYYPGDDLFDSSYLPKGEFRCQHLSEKPARSHYTAGLRDGFTGVIGELLSTVVTVAGMPEAGSDFTEGVLWDWLIALQALHSSVLQDPVDEELSAILHERCGEGLLVAEVFRGLVISRLKRPLSEGFANSNWPWNPGGDSQLGSAGPPYFWNGWADRLIDPNDPVKPRFEPVYHLEPTSRYVVSIDLSGIPYEAEGVIDLPSGEEFRDVISRFLARPSLKELRLRPVVLTDGKLVRSGRQILDDFVVELDKIRRYTSAPTIESGRYAMGELRKGKDPAYFFGRLSFEITTTDATGDTVIGLSFWDATSGRPIEELRLPFCVRRPDDPPCTSWGPSTTSLGGHALIDTAPGTDPAHGPAAALHVIELSPSWVSGVFKRNDADTPNAFHVWTISDDSPGFLARLAQIQDNYGVVVGDPVGVGQALTNLMFPIGNANAQTAVTAFRAFFEERKIQVPFQPNPPVLFTRMVLGRHGAPALYPLGLMNLGDNESSFLGYRFRIDNPLPWQDYRTAQSVCADRWIPVLPPRTSDPELKAARERLADRLEWTPDGATFRPSARVGAVPVYDDMKIFRRWIGDARGEASGTVVAVLSHHDENALFFDRRRAVVYSTNVARKFREPAIAILSGCSTGRIGASELLGQLNLRGVDAAIATNTGISGRLAGDFMECLGRTLDEGSDTLSVAEAFWSTQGCLYELRAQGTGERIYGPRVLSFSLAGNPSLAFCAGERR